MYNLIIYGGTFDPVHNGHINIALKVQKKIHFDKFIFLPCRTPALKQEPLSTPEQRVKMLQIALQNLPPTFEIDLLEINRAGPSYMVDSLLHFRSQLGTTFPITLLLGMDSFIQLPYWHRWEEILKLANLCVVNRPGNILCFSEPVKTLLDSKKTEDFKLLLNHPSGAIYHFNTRDYDISSTLIRQELAQRKWVNSIPEAVMLYIKENKIYLS